MGCTWSGAQKVQEQMTSNSGKRSWKKDPSVSFLYSSLNIWAWPLSWAGEQGLWPNTILTSVLLRSYAQTFTFTEGPFTEALYSTWKQLYFSHVFYVLMHLWAFKLRNTPYFLPCISTIYLHYRTMHLGISFPIIQKDKNDKSPLEETKKYLIS